MFIRVHSHFSQREYKHTSTQFKRTMKMCPQREINPYVNTSCYYLFQFLHHLPGLLFKRNNSQVTCFPSDSWTDTKLQFLSKFNTTFNWVILVKKIMMLRKYKYRYAYLCISDWTTELSLMLEFLTFCLFEWNGGTPSSTISTALSKVQENLGRKGVAVQQVQNFSHSR